MEVTYFKRVQEDNEAIKDYLLDKIVDLRKKLEEKNKRIKELELKIYDLQDEIEELKQEQKEKKDVYDYFEEI